MKNQLTTPPHTNTPRTRRFARLLSGMAVLATILLPASLAQAQVNVLADPGAESSVPGSATFVGWDQWGSSSFWVGNDTNISPGPTPPHSGTNFFKMWGNYNNATDYDGFFQQIGAHPGEVFTADGWVYQNSADSFAGGANTAVIEVTFLDISGNTLARYRSMSITNGSPTNVWYDLPVTNQLDPVSYAEIGLATNMVAPPNTVQVEYDIVFNLVNYGGGSIYLDDLSLLTTAPPPPFVTNIAPANVILATNQDFTFQAVAQSGSITNIQMIVTTVNGIVNPVTNTVTYSTALTNLPVTGLGSAAAAVNFPLGTNLAYTITILAVDSNGGTAVGNATFDTIQPVFVWEAEDFNFGGGQTLSTPADGGVNLFAGMVGTANIDEFWIPAAGQSDLYRPNDAVSIGGAYEIPRQKFLNAISSGSNTNALDYEVGYNSVNDWEDYTRTFPAGNYNIYARLAASGTQQKISLGLVGGNVTTSSQTVTNLGVCTLASDNNWNGYEYCPLTDAFGNLVTVHLGGTQTIRATDTAGGPNINFYMILPATGSPYPAQVSAYPTGLHPFEPTNKFSMTVGPANGSAISTNGIHMTLNGTDVSSNLIFTAGVSNTWTFTYPLAYNTIYTAVVNVTNTTSLKSTFTLNFDTFSETNFMWEAEDYDFSGGQFIDNPIPTFDPTVNGGGVLAVGSYCGYPNNDFGNTATFGVDFNWSAVSGETSLYRPDAVGTQPASDYLRHKFIVSQTNLDNPNICDVNIGYWDGGFWLNYTRTYPTGNFYIYGRLAGGGGAFSGTSLSVVTNGYGTTTQLTNTLGTFSDPNAAGWQSWHWILMLNTNGAPAIASLGGVETLQIMSGGNVNANYYMLVPAPAVIPTVKLSVALVGGQPAISFVSAANHTYTLVYKTSLTDAGWTTVTSVAGDGTPKTLTDTGTAGVVRRYYAVQIQ